MKPIELRKGNIVYQDGEMINGVTINTIHRFDMGEIQLEPVVLDDFLLERLGAEKTNNLLFHYERFRLNWQEKYKYWYVTDKDSMTYITKIEFVHEWQNFLLFVNGQDVKLKQ